MSTKRFGIDAWTLKLLAMLTMVIDHIGAVLLTQHIILRIIGRISFPIFSFFIAEGYKKTKDFKKYLLRMVFFALISEIPYNLMVTGQIWNPEDQNVLFTFSIALALLRLNDLIREKLKFPKALSMLICFTLGLALGTVLRVDYGGFGVALVLMFYAFPEEKEARVLEFGLMLLINTVLIPSSVLYYWIGQRLFSIHVQTFAIITLPLLWLYNGQRGKSGKIRQYSAYAFYPVQCLVIGLVALLIR